MNLTHAGGDALARGWPTVLGRVPLPGGHRPYPGCVGTPHPARPLRSYKRRGGRIRPGQRAALDRLLPTWGVPVGDQPIDLEAVFGRRADVVLEVGFGMGEATLAMAAADPDRDVLAVDVHTPGAGALLREASAAGLSNIRVVIGDARHVLSHMLAVGSLAEVRIFFPDPWPKARHHKRRLVTPSFVHLAATRLRAGGGLHLATDWVDYAVVMLAAVTSEPLLRNRFDAYAPRPPGRPVTRFEGQGLAKGHRVLDVIAERIGPDREVVVHPAGVRTSCRSAIPPRT